MFPVELSAATTTRSITGGIGSKRQLTIWFSGQLNLSCIQVAQWKKKLVSYRNGNNCYCYRCESVNQCGTVSASDRGWLRMCINCSDLISFAPSFEFLDVCACVALQSISQRQQLLSCRKILLMLTTSLTPLRSNRTWRHVLCSFFRLLIPPTSLTVGAAATVDAHGRSATKPRWRHIFQT